MCCFAGKNIINLALLSGSIYYAWQFMQATAPAAANSALLVVAGLAGILGWHLTASIGGADMPVVVTLLNSYSGMLRNPASHAVQQLSESLQGHQRTQSIYSPACRCWCCPTGYALCAEGFMLDNVLLTVVGALIGSSGAILSAIMCKVRVTACPAGCASQDLRQLAESDSPYFFVSNGPQAMNRSLTNVIFGGIGTAAAPAKGTVGVCDTDTKLCHTEIDIDGELWAHRCQAIGCRYSCNSDRGKDNQPLMKCMYVCRARRC